MEKEREVGSLKLKVEGREVFKEEESRSEEGEEWRRKERGRRYGGGMCHLRAIVS